MPSRVPESLRFLLLQVRNADDPMRQHERLAFARTLEIDVERCEVLDLLTTRPSPSQLDASDVVLLGGSGDYSATGEGGWLDRSLDVLRDLVDRRQPTFASCWGFQAMARALGGTVVHDLDTAEVGTHQLYLTEAGVTDPVFSSLHHEFLAQMGHEDCVSALPEGATRLAFSHRNAHQAFRLEQAPVYCTQFHPELSREDLHQRVKAYPQYIERISGMTTDEFTAALCDTPDAAGLLQRFVETVVAG